MRRAVNTGAATPGLDGAEKGGYSKPMRPLLVAALAVAALASPLFAAEPKPVNTDAPAAVPCPKNAERESRTYIVRIKYLPNKNGPSEFRLKHFGCWLDKHEWNVLNKNHSVKGYESGAYGDDDHTLGLIVADGIGTDHAAVIVQLPKGGKGAKDLCYRAYLGNIQKDYTRVWGTTLDKVKFEDTCTGVPWESDVQLIPLAF